MANTFFRFCSVVCLLICVVARVESAPKFPAAFDQLTVTRMIAEIDKGTNFPVLKAGYFIGRRRPPFPVSKGLSLLQTSAQKEKRGSKRWLLMQWLRAFGTLRSGPQGHTPAMLIYGGILDEVIKTPQVAEPKIVQRIIDDFVFSLPGAFITANGQDTTSVEATLKKAAYAHFRIGSPLERNADELRPNFLDSVWRVSSFATQISPEKSWVQLIERAEKDPRVPKNYDFYFSAAQILRSVNTARKEDLTRRALALLTKGEKLLKPGDKRLLEAQAEKKILEEWLQPPDPKDAEPQSEGQIKTKAPAKFAGAFVFIWRCALR